MAKLNVVQVPTIQKPIQDSPGFAKKMLADAKLDVMALCGFGCSYCSSNTGNYLRINREEFADLTEAQLGLRTYPADDPSLTFTWPDLLDHLAAQLATKKKSWGAGKTLIVSQLTDAFSPLAVAPIDGGPSLTERALTMVLESTSFRIRVLTKGAVVASSKWIEFFLRYPGRFVVGLSVGSLDDEWARRVEVGTSSPSARVRATRALQDAGVPTFAMFCPIFPDAMDGEALDRLIEGIRPERCETVWAEPFNDRGNWRKVQAGYEPGSAGHRWFDDVYKLGQAGAWSRYATDLYRALHNRSIGTDGWTDKLHYLLYEGDITRNDAPTFAGFSGVLLQGTCTEAIARDAEQRVILMTAGPRKGQPKMVSTGWSSNAHIRALQRYEGQGYAKPGFAPPAAPAVETVRST